VRFTTYAGIISPTYVSHVGDWLTTSASHVEDLQLAIASHDGGTNLVITSHTAHTSPTSVIHGGHSSPTSVCHVGDFILASASHAGSMSPATTSHAGGIHTIEKPRRVRCKPKFLCMLCKGHHLTHLCPATIVLQEAWSLTEGPSNSESYLASQPSLVDTTVMSMQSSSNTHLPLGVDASLDLVFSHPFQPTVEEVVVLMQSSADPTLLLESDKPKEVTSPMQYLVNPTLILEGDASFDHVFKISSFVPSSLESFPLSSSMLPPSPREVSFDWNDIVEP
jgi:hypothetical protein